MLIFFPFIHVRCRIYYILGLIFESAGAVVLYEKHLNAIPITIS